MATPHNAASAGQIAKTVLMPGDPLRAKFIAETFLENPVEFNSVRNMLGYTGTYKGENIVRIGSTGTYKEDIDVFETIIATGSFSESSYAKCMCGDENSFQYPDAGLNEKLKKAAEKLGISCREGLIWSSDVFYYDEKMLPGALQTAIDNNLIAAEMESFGLFATAKNLGKKAACILTVSDNIITHVETTAEERQSKLVDMIKIALEAVEAE